MDVTFSLRALCADDAASYQALRLDGLRRHPEAFGAALADEADKPLAWFAARLQGNQVFGCRLADGSLVGVAGLSVPHSTRLRHKGFLWGMYVKPEARGTGMAAALMHRVIKQADGALEEILLTFTASNTPAAKLYARHGFQQYGLEPRAFKIEDSYHDMVLMRLCLPTAR